MYKPMILNNAQGARQIITTLTAVAQKVSEQKFYEIPFADYVPVVPGVGAFDYDILNWRSFSKDDGFEKGLIGSNSNRAQRGQSDAVFDAVKQSTQFWAKNIECLLSSSNKLPRQTTSSRSSKHVKLPARNHGT